MEDHDACEAARGPWQRPPVMLQRQPDGAFIDWGRHVTVNGVRGEGGASYYKGEAAEVLALVLKHSGVSPSQPETGKAV